MNTSLNTDENTVVLYSGYGNTSPKMEAVSFTLFDNILLRMKLDTENATVSMNMSDAISENTELEGYMDLEKLNTLIKALSQLRNQIVNGE